MYKKMVEFNDKLTVYYFEKQINDVNNRYCGGVINEKTGIPSPSHVVTGSVIGVWASSYINRDSKYYHDPLLESRISHALDYMLEQQHEDGTISPGWTNYHSPPDTGFIITGFAQIYNLLKNDKSTGAKELNNKISLFLKRTIPAMLTGGCHTPNHRWVITSALAHLYYIFRKDELLERAEEWLNEGIDITEDGEWTERSNGIYNSVSNIFLYYAGQLLDKPELLDYVRKNLDMMKYLVHFNGDIVTDYSGRQDYGDAYNLSSYHLIYRLMAVHDNNAVYGAMADLAAESLTDMGPVNNQIMLGYLTFPFIQQVNFKQVVLPTDYEVFINEKFPIDDNLLKMEKIGHQSKIEHSSMHTSFGAPTVRYRNDTRSATIMSKNASIFSLRNGNASLLGVQVYTSFTPGLIEFDNIERIVGGYRLKKHMEKGYTGPIPKNQSSSEENRSIWYLLPHQHRKLTHNQTYEMEIDISNEDNVWKVHIKSDERTDVFTQIVFLFGSNGHLSGKGVYPDSKGAYFWKSDKLTFDTGDDRIIFDSGDYEHWMESIGDIHFNNGIQAVKVNLISPVNKVFRIICK